MPKWNYTIDLNAFWDDEEMTIPEKGVAVKKEIEKLLEKHPRLANETDLEYMAEMFANVTGWPAEDGYAAVSEMEEFNIRMNELYDIADAYRIWVCTTLPASSYSGGR